MFRLYSKFNMTIFSWSTVLCFINALPNEIGSLNLTKIVNQKNFSHQLHNEVKTRLFLVIPSFKWIVSTNQCYEILAEKKNKFKAVFIFCRILFSFKHRITFFSAHFLKVTHDTCVLAVWRPVHSKVFWPIILILNEDWSCYNIKTML